MQSVTVWSENVSRTMLKEAAACSRRPTRPDSLKYFPAQMPSSSGDRTSSDTADSSNTLDEIFCRKKWKNNQTTQKNINFNVSLIVGLNLCAPVFATTSYTCVILPTCVVYKKNESFKQYSLTWNVTQPIGR